MDSMLKYDVDKLLIIQDKWDKNFAAKTESMMSLGNGYLGLRSVDEEIEKFNKEDLFVNGIFNKENSDEVSELANLADLIQNQILIDGEIFSLCKEDQYKKTLFIKNGFLEREIIAKRNNKTFSITFQRFVSQAKENLYFQKIVIKQLSGKESKITLLPEINGQTTNNGAQHFKEGIKRRLSLDSVQYIEETTSSNNMVIHNLLAEVKLNNKKIKAGTDDYLLTMSRRKVGFKINVKINLKTKITLTKLMSVNTSVDNKESIKSNSYVKNQANKLYDYLKNTSFKKELDLSNDYWKKIWNQFFIEIKGGKEAKYDSLANAFGIFHMNSFVPKNNSNLSVAAKGLSGEGYQGHCFWDTEFFIAPNYLYTKPEIARNLLEYRYKGIEGARLKAKEQKERKEESNLEGAQYPWETAWPSDGEVCPYWGQADVVTGKQVPIASRRQEIHVSADVAFAVHQYYDFTNDNTFMNKMGYEIIFDTAWFWTQRVEKQKNGTYMIKDVMGPNEYKGNIDNNAYINAFAKENLKLALRYYDNLNKTTKGKKILQTALNKIPYSISFNKIKEVAEKLVQQIPNKDLIIAENDSFLKLKRNNLSKFQLLGDAGKKLFNTKEGQNNLSGQIVKQADVVLLTYLLPHLFSKDVIEKNFEFYEPITTHDSSLSPTTYTIQAIDIRKMDLAYKLYKYSLNIDMGPNMKSCDAGIHSGSLAAIWQTTVFGYGGLRWIDGKIHFNPILPKQWDSLKYRVTYKGVDIEVKVNQKHFTIKTLNNKKLEVIINGENKLISEKILKESVK